MGAGANAFCGGVASTILKRLRLLAQTKPQLQFWKLSRRRKSSGELALAQTVRPAARAPPCSPCRTTVFPSSPICAPREIIFNRPAGCPTL